MNIMQMNLDYIPSVYSSIYSRNYLPNKIKRSVYNKFR